MGHQDHAKSQGWWNTPRGWFTLGHCIWGCHLNAAHHSNSKMLHKESVSLRLLQKDYNFQNDFPAVFSDATNCNPPNRETRPRRSCYLRREPGISQISLKTHLPKKMYTWLDALQCQVQWTQSWGGTPHLRVLFRCSSHGFPLIFSWNLHACGPDAQAVQAESWNPNGSDPWLCVSSETTGP